MSLELSDIFSKKDNDPLERFRIKSTILNNLGPNGLRIYNAIDGTKTVSEIVELLGLDEREVLENLNLLIKLGAIVKVDSSSSQLPKEENSDLDSSTSLDENIEEDVQTKKNLESGDTAFLENQNLSEAEKEIFDKFGKVGLKVFSMIDGYRSAQEIMEEVGINESLLIEILEFLNQRGFITLETKNQKQDSTEKTLKQIEKQNERNPVSPIIEKQPYSPISIADESYLVFVPKLQKLSIIDETKLKFLLKFKYKLNSNFLDYLKGEHDVIDLFFISELPFENLINLLKELKNEGYLSLSSLSRNEIEKKYGTIALSAYKKFGVQGLLVYNFIGKTNSLLDLVKKSRIEPKKASEILLFLSNVLGLDIKIDKEKLYNALQKS